LDPLISRGTGNSVLTGNVVLTGNQVSEEDILEKEIEEDIIQDIEEQDLLELIEKYLNEKNYEKAIEISTSKLNSLSSEIKEGETPPPLVKILQDIKTSIENDEEFLAQKLIEERKKELKEIIGDLKSETGSVKSYDDREEIYKKVMREYESIYLNFPNEKYPDTAVSSVGEQAMIEAIYLSWKLGQKKTAIDLCNGFKQKYPNSNEKLNFCKDDFSISNTGDSNRDVVILGRLKSISFEGIFEPSLEDYSVELFIKGANNDYSGVRTIQKGEDIYLSEKEFITLNKIEKDMAVFDASSILESTGREVFWKTNELKINKSGYKIIGKTNYEVRVNKINLNEVVKVSVVPNIDNKGTEANFGFKVGIEKRAIQLSPEQIEKKVDFLGGEISKWESRSEKIGGVVKSLKSACLVVGGVLTLKTLFEVKGEAIARQNAMRGEGGWYEQCRDLTEQGKYSSMQDCLNKNAKEIESSMNRELNAITTTNEELKEIQKDVGSDDDIFGGKVYNEDEIKGKYVPFTQNKLSGQSFEKDGEKITITKNEEDLIYHNLDKLSTEDLREINKDLTLIKNSPNTEDSKRAQKRVYTTLFKIKELEETEIKRERLEEKFGMKVDVGSNEKLTKIRFSNANTFSQVKNNFDISGSKKFPNSTSFVRTFFNQANGKSYLIELNDDYNLRQTYLINENNQLEVTESANPLKLSYVMVDSSYYNNEYKSPELKYYETEPYKGYPAIVPFDVKKGWYSSVSQSVPAFGGKASYEASGRVSSFWVCNVGENGREENRGGDDDCLLVNTGTGQPLGEFGNLDEREAEKIINEATNAILRAQRLYSSIKPNSYVKISDNAQKVKVSGTPALDIPDMQCQDFMSPTDCNLLFNVCDPVICPSSRCNFGGTYYERDVIQSGIVGSALLCLPNYKEGIYFPVCISGVKAGLDGYISVLKAHKDCLDENLKTGKTVGICDEIYSVHLCELFWKQTIPLAKLIVPKTLETIYGQRTQGGGEYLGVASAWNNAEKSFDYFTSYYATNSFATFKARVVEGIGDAVCQNSISAVYPDGGNIFSSLTDPVSPPQFHGRFDETEFTTTTVPPISHYKVFYHIYAGDTSQAYYRVYLKPSGEASLYQDFSSRRNIESGYIPAGGYATETKDFTAPSGYKQLCIDVNGQEECGFKQVSTSFAVDYVEDKYLQEQVERTDISSEKDCISGTTSIYSLVNPNLQSTGEELINPEIYNRGIVRICATQSPGKGTDAKYASEDARWVAIGFCDDDQRIKCWQDRESVKNVIDFTDIRGDALKKQNENYLEFLGSEGEYFTSERIDDIIKEVEKTKKPRDVINIVENTLPKVFWNNQKAQLMYLRARAYRDLLRKLFI
jgi:hypothetical protein